MWRATWTEVEEPPGKQETQGAGKRPVLAPEVSLFVRCLAPLVLFLPRFRELRSFPYLFREVEQTSDLTTVCSRSHGKELCPGAGSAEVRTMNFTGTQVPAAPPCS